MITLLVFSSAVIVILLHWYWVKKANKLQRIKLILCLFLIAMLSLGIIYIYQKNSYSLPKEEMKQKALEIVKSYEWFQPYKDDVTLQVGIPKYYYVGSLFVNASDDKWNMFFDRLKGGKQLYMIYISISPSIPAYRECDLNGNIINPILNISEQSCERYTHWVEYVDKHGNNEKKRMINQISEIYIVIDRWGNDVSSDPRIDWDDYYEELRRLYSSFN